MKALVVTCSNRAAAGVYEDTTGPLIVEALRSWGFEVADPLVVPDGLPVEEALREAVELRYEAVVTTGGTGISPTDATPEATEAVLERTLPGVAEAIRAYGVAAGVPSAMLSRGMAGVADQTVIVNLPGSRGGVKDGLTVLSDVLLHAVEQVAGVDHERTDDGGAS
ncbi:MogA/MoaB family molybdenum cofactor biosynthesis protein [Mumia sp. ZJ1417]|uniref:MogA/MoaB family molybdenum cofactor biosynthesis protein n=1 Tax=unclassified Mumia TaxID=2621872 RepID=UPI0014210B3D|nr:MULTISPECIES: MogA/MoaB family molybdenum cofactor biosynthesis protein [unclassified Mumia]QMW67088.1 MogA/MoaB family molybdenum cofactor biosynthesis protein [Mumia sp. ZJ1417]